MQISCTEGSAPVDVCPKFTHFKGQSKKKTYLWISKQNFATAVDICQGILRTKCSFCCAKNTVSVLYNLMYHAVYLVVTCCHTDLHRETLYSRLCMKSFKDNGWNCAVCIVAASGTQCRCNPFLTVQKILI